MIFAGIKGINLMNFGGRPVLSLTTAFVDSFAVMMIIGSMKYISATKSSLIVQCNPTLTVIVGVVFMREVITNYEKLGVLLMLGGIVVIALNKSTIESDVDDPLRGYAMALTGAVILSFVMIGLRKMNRTAHPIIFPFYFSLGLVLICVAAYLTVDNAVNVQHYAALDFAMNCTSACGSLFGLIFMSLAYIHADASHLAPLTNIQNVFNFGAEFLVLGYNFGATDFVGVLILLVAFLIPVVTKIKSQ